MENDDWVGVGGLPSPFRPDEPFPGAIWIKPGETGGRQRIFGLRIEMAEDGIDRKVLDELPIGMLEASLAHYHGDHLRAAAEREFRLTSGPVDGLTDDFLRDLSRAYMAALSRGVKKPNVELAKQLGHDKTRTIERWVYLARQRGFLPKGRKGAAG